LPLTRTDQPTLAGVNLGEAVAAILAGELVVFPTETFYGIAADPMRPDAIRRIFAAKGREPGKAIALIAADSRSAFSLIREIPHKAGLLAERFWPGPLTLVLPARPGLDPALIGPEGGVGVRVSPHPIARALARGAGGLVTATSANLSGEAPASTIEQARAALGTRVKVYLDCGPLEGARPSTVVAVGKGGSFHVLRAGVIEPSAIAAVLAG
jgi:L-threonylcarbamoyladenylate synthase